MIKTTLELSVERDGRNIRYVKNQTPELCKMAVQQNGFALKNCVN